MSDLMSIMTAVLCIAMVGAALVAIKGKSLPVAIMASPDVAMTEAAIGSGLTTFLFFFVLGRVRAGENDGDERG
jgi:uncharacterized MnhB-related membrane protein